MVLMADGMEPVLAAEKQLGVLASRSSRSALPRPLSVGFRREARRAGRPQRENGEPCMGLYELQPLVYKPRCAKFCHAKLCHRVDCSACHVCDADAGARRWRRTYASASADDRESEVNCSSQGEFVLSGQRWPAAGHVFDEGLARAIQRYVGSASILDIGAGSGAYGAYFTAEAARGAEAPRYTGVDGAVNVEAFTRTYGPPGSLVTHATVCDTSLRLPRADYVVTMWLHCGYNVVTMWLQCGYIVRHELAPASCRLRPLTRGRRAPARGLLTPLHAAAAPEQPPRHPPLMGNPCPGRHLPHLHAARGGRGARGRGHGLRACRSGHGGAGFLDFDFYPK